MSELKVIYLGLACQEQGKIDGREWCQHDVWDACECGHESVRYVLGSEFDRLTAERDALQQCLTAADELADTMEGLLRLARGAIGENQWTLLTKDIDTMLSQDAQRTNNSRNAHCPHDGICHTSEETCADAQERIASLTAPAGAGQ